jgi:antibiotic biosynthesis monooxygenase (ABM) superfamily enzyme
MHFSADTINLQAVAVELESTTMVTLFVRHKVEDFGKWKAAYDAFEEQRTKLGVTGHGAYRNDHDDHEVTVYHHFDDLDTAKTFAESTEVQAAMGSSGVVGVPDIWFANRL